MFESFPDVMNVQQLSKALGVCRNTAYELVNTNAIACRRVRNRILVPKPFVIDFLLHNEYNTPCNGGFSQSGKETVI